MRINNLHIENKKEKSILNQVWFKYFPYWPLFVIFTSLFMAGAWAYLRFTIPVYEATAAILIKDEKKGADDAKVIESFNQLTASKLIENEIEVLSSRELMAEVVNKLHLYAPIMQEGKVKAYSGYNTAPIIIEARNPDSVVQSNKKIPLNFDKAKQQVALDGETYPLNQWVSTPWGNFRFTERNTNYVTIGDLFCYFYDPRLVTADLLNKLTVAASNKASTVINLSVKHIDPKCAEDILNELMNAYNRAALNDKNILANTTLSFLNERLGKVGGQLDTIERKLQQYKASTGAIEISSQGNMYLQNVSAVDQRLAEVNTQLVVLNQVEDYVRAKNKSGGIVPSTMGISDPLLGDLLNKLYTYELEYEKMKRTTAENNPMLVSITDQIEKIRPSILENINNQKSGLEANKSNLSTLTNRYSSMLSSIPKKERDLVEISRNQSIVNSIYNFLLQKKEETELALSSSVANSRIVDKAQASFGPVSPNSKLIYLIAIAAAFAIAVIIITANEMINPTILFRHEIEEYTTVPVIGEVIHNTSKDPIVIGAGKRTFIAEQFRNLRTSLPYLGINSGKKRLIVTSSISGEGKSFVVANLGVSLAMAGKKVVVLEFDLSDPTLSAKLGVTATKGLTEYLKGEIEKEDIIKRTGVHENLFIISAGSLPDNPSELIMDKKVPELLDYLSDIFDNIIIDTAPVGILSDAYILSNYCDATLYMVRHRYTPKTHVERIDANNKINQLKNLAIVFNGVKARGFGRGGYGYGYGYGYISDDKKRSGKRKKEKTTV